MMKGDQYQLSNKNKENQEYWREVAILRGMVMTLERLKREGMSILGRVTTQTPSGGNTSGLFNN